MTPRIPPLTTPVAEAEGSINPLWHRYFQALQSKIGDANGLPDAPNNGLFYARRNQAWQSFTIPDPINPYGQVNVYNVGFTEGMYPNVPSAIAAINAGVPPSVNNRSMVYVWPGKYVTSSVITVPQFVGIKGLSKGLVQFQNDSTDLFKCSGDTFFEDFLVEGSPNASLYAFDGNNANAVHVRNVDMLRNVGDVSRQKFLKQSGATWEILFIEHCIIDYRALNDYAVLLENTSGAARFVDTNINDVFFDAFNLTNFGGSFLLRGVQDVRIKRSTIRGAATWNTGIRLERFGVTGTPSVEVRQCDMAGPQNAAGGVSIFNEAGTAAYVSNTDAPNSIFSGASVVRNSFVT
jgi:hypothetical protein